MYTLDELLAIFPFISHSAEFESELCVHFRTVGGAPRYVLNRVEFEQRAIQMHNATNRANCNLIELFLGSDTALTV